jgi:hypothetical protein
MGDAAGRWEKAYVDDAEIARELPGEHGILPQLEHVARSRERHIDNGLRPPRIKAAGIEPQ